MPRRATISGRNGAGARGFTPADKTDAQDVVEVDVTTEAVALTGSDPDRYEAVTTAGPEVTAFVAPTPGGFALTGSF